MGLPFLAVTKVFQWSSDPVILFINLFLINGIVHLLKM